MTDPQSLGERAFAHVYHLAAEIGPRPAGSEAERRAFTYLEERLGASGYAPQSQPVTFAPLPRFFPVFALGGALVLAGGLLLATAPWLAMLAPLVILPLPDLARELIQRRARTARSQNLIAYTSADEAAPTLIFCAHVDSAPASVFGARWLLALHQQIMFVALRVGWALAAVAILLLLGLALPEPVTRVVGGAAIVTGGVWAAMEALNQLMRRRWSPGAHDNASGVGVALALAEHFAQQPPARQRLGFLFTGAEETGLHGAEAFAAQLALKGQRVAVLNLDMVGAGDRLTYVQHDGALWLWATEARLNQLIRNADAKATPIVNALRSGDYLPFLRHGLRAASLETRGARDAELAYHTVNDTAEVIDIGTLGMTAQTVIELVAQAEAQGYPERTA